MSTLFVLLILTLTYHLSICVFQLWRFISNFCVWCAWAWVSLFVPPVYWSPWEPEEGTGSPVTAVTGSCGLSCVCWQPTTGPLQGWWALSRTTFPPCIMPPELPSCFSNHWCEWTVCWSTMFPRASLCDVIAAVLCFLEALKSSEGSSSKIPYIIILSSYIYIKQSLFYFWMSLWQHQNWPPCVLYPFVIFPKLGGSRMSFHHGHSASCPPFLLNWFGNQLYLFSALSTP